MPPWVVICSLQTESSPLGPSGPGIPWSLRSLMASRLLSAEPCAAWQGPGAGRAQKLPGEQGPTVGVDEMSCLLAEKAAFMCPDSSRVRAGGSLVPRPRFVTPGWPGTVTGGLIPVGTRKPFLFSFLFLSCLVLSCLSFLFFLADIYFLILKISQT